MENYTESESGSQRSEIYSEGSETRYSVQEGETFRPGRKTNQLWKINNAKAQKNGRRHTIYWTKSSINTSGLEPKKVWKAGDTYQGDWLDNKKHGRGTLSWANNGKYEGEWSENKRNGEGTYWVKQKNGKYRKEYTGEWVDNKRSGFGIRFYEDGNKYEGEWETNLRHGRGRQTYSDGSVYEGDWWEDKRSGYGIMTYANGDRYEGHWVDDKKEGEGVFFYRKTGKRMDGEWVDDVCKCGTLSSAEDESDIGVEDIPSRFYPGGKFDVPECGLADPDSLLERRIIRIQRVRASFRAKKGSMFDLFTSEELEAIRKAFSHVDVDGQGFIAAEEVPMVFSELDMYVDDGLVMSLFEEMEVDPNSYVTFDDFVRMLFLYREYEDEHREFEEQQMILSMQNQDNDEAPEEYWEEGEQLEDGAGSSRGSEQ